MNPLLDRFFQYLAIEKGLAANTCEAYRRDLLRFADYLEEEGIA